MKSKFKELEHETENELKERKLHLTANAPTKSSSNEQTDPPQHCDI